MKGRNKQKDALFHVAVNSCDCKCWRYTNKVSIWLTDQMIETKENQNRNTRRKSSANVSLFTTNSTQTGLVSDLSLRCRGRRQKGREHLELWT